jgi:1-deoxy-D-xylulose 5-phosphate reductoisomerase
MYEITKVPAPEVAVTLAWVNVMIAGDVPTLFTRTAPAALSAANEIVVDAFLAGRITWSQIGTFVSRVMEKFVVTVPTSVDDVLDADAQGRRLATEELSR